MKFISYLVFYIIQLTWGILLNVWGILVALFMIITLHKPHKFGPSIYFVCHKLDGFGFEAGIFFVIGKDCVGDEIMWHEAGHGVQNIIFGPLFPFIIGIPSVIRYWYLDLKYYRKGLDYDYDSIWFEKQATKLGAKVYFL